MQSKTKFSTLFVAGVCALAVAGNGLKVRAEADEKDDGNEAKVTLPAAQLKACIATALKAKPGKVLETEAETEKGKTHCDVIILAKDGKTYEVEVDVASNKVTDIEEDNDKGDDDDD